LASDPVLNDFSQLLNLLFPHLFYRLFDLVDQFIFVALYLGLPIGTGQDASFSCLGEHLKSLGLSHLTVESELLLNLLVPRFDLFHFLLKVLLVLCAQVFQLRSKGFEQSVH
jgi:hypothetical protein